MIPATKKVKTNVYLPSCLIVTDIPGWAMDNLADNLIAVLGEKFRFTKKAIELENRVELEATYPDYDIVYVMLPSYLSADAADNIITTFHGGPGVEGQADYIDRARQNDMRISYGNLQVKERVTTLEWKSNRRVKAPVSFQADEKKLLQEQNLSGDDVVDFKIDPEFAKHPKWPEYQKYNDIHLPVNLHIWRHGFGLTNLFYTPYGINKDEYKSNVKINQSKLSCGYAGWAKYILGAQSEHRRIGWILQAQKELDFEVYFAGGLMKYAEDDINEVKILHKDNLKIHIDAYTKEKIHEFYTKINCYLVPDKYAGGPLPVLEAGLFGIPPVTMPCGICNDFITHMKTGYMAKTKEDFFKGIAFMAKNPEKRIEMGQNLKEYILKNKQWKHVSDYWERFFKGDDDDI